MLQNKRIIKYMPSEDYGSFKILVCSMIESQFADYPII